MQGWNDAGYWKLRAESAEDEIVRLRKLLREAEVAVRLVSTLRLALKEEPDAEA